jgi:ATP-dependent DNA helicase RecG
MRAKAGLIEELKWQSRGRSFDTMPIYHASLDDLDTNKVTSFLANRTAVTSVEVSKKVLGSYFIACEEHARWYPTAAGILLFGKDPQRFLSEAMIICTHFAGTAGREVIATKDCTGTLVEQFNAASEFVLSSLHKSFTIKGSKRSETLELPPEALREIILNAVVHRNYHLPAPSKIAIYQDRVEIFSPGNFPGVLDTHNLLQGISYLRNIALCKVFREMGYIEKLGSGFITTFESYARRGLPMPHIFEGENYIKCVLPRLTAKARRTTQRKKVISLEDQRILNLLQQAGEISITDIIKNLHMPRASAGKKLAILVSQGELLKIGQGRGTKYKKK